MEGIIDQLLEDLKAYFATLPEYQDILIKEQYDIYPKISYPAITIEEIENADDNRYFDETERITNLGYQFAIYSEQSETNTAIKNVSIIAELIDTYLKGPKYRCLKRIGSLVKVPMPKDDNVIIGYLRYNCALARDTNTIYRRY